MKEGKLAHVEVSKITYGSRYREEMGDLSALKESIQEEGLIHPIAIMEKEDGYILLAGGRRFNAVKELGWIQVPCHIYSPLDDLDRRTIELKENMVRENLSFSEEAKITLEIHKLQKEKYGDPKYMCDGHTIRDTAQILGQSSSKVFQDIQLGEMLEQVPELALCKDRQEALKLLKKAQEEIKRDVKAAAYEASIALKGGDTLRKDLIDSFIINDFKIGVKTIAPSSFDLIEIDPPYAIDLHKVKKTEDFISTKDYIEIKPEQYISDLHIMLQESYRVLKENGWLLMWFSIKWWFEETAKAIEEEGFKLNRLPIIWVKGNGQTLRPDLHLPSCYDTMFYARKGMATIKKQGNPNLLLTPTMSTSDKSHPTERPIELYEELFSIFATSGDLLLIPYLGSGNALLAANNLRMKGIGFDLDQGNKNYFINKVQEGIPGTYKSLGG